MVPKLCSAKEYESQFRAEDIERFWSRVEKTSDCWLWIGTVTQRRYGVFGCSRRRLAAHRVSYQLANGLIPEGLVVDHKCHNTICVNPSHLRAVTNKQNIENQRGAHRNSKSGVRGVRPCRYGRWRAEVRHNGVKVSAGSYKTIAEAEAAAIAKRLELFTHNDADRRIKN